MREILKKVLKLLDIHIVHSKEPITSIAEHAKQIIIYTNFRKKKNYFFAIDNTLR